MTLLSLWNHSTKLTIIIMLTKIKIKLFQTAIIWKLFKLCLSSNIVFRWALLLIKLISVILRTRCCAILELAYNLPLTYLCLQGESDMSYEDHVPLVTDPSVEVIGDILSKLSAVQIQTIMNSVFEEMLGDVKVRYCPIRILYLP